MLGLRALLARGAALLLLVAPVDAAVLRHASDQNHTKRNVDYQIVLANFNNVQYSGAFSLGGQSLPVVYDTGSFEILVLSTLCTSCSPALAKYDSSRSTTFVSAGGLEAQHVFGSGPVNSKKGFETVWIGDANSPYQVGNMPFWEVTDHDIAVWNEHAHFSGIVGLCHPAQVPPGFSATEKNQPGDYTLLAASQIDAFSFCFQRHSQNASGYFYMGPSQSALAHSGNFVPLPVVGQVHWGVSMTSISAAGVAVDNPCVPSCGAIIDSGTSLIAAPPSASGLINALKSMIKSDCSNIDSLPVLHLTLGGVHLELPPRAYVIKASLLGLRIPLDPVGAWDFIWNGPTTTVVDQCTVAFMTIEKDSQFGPVWILGMPFMRYYYSIFQRSTKQIHVARASPYCQVPYGGPHVFTNISDAKGVGSHVALRGTSSAGYSNSDFLPTWVDLKAARLPKWARDNTTKELTI